MRFSGLWNEKGLPWRSFSFSGVGCRMSDRIRVPEGLSLEFSPSSESEAKEDSQGYRGQAPLPRGMKASFLPEDGWRITPIGIVALWYIASFSCGALGVFGEEAGMVILGVLVALGVPGILLADSHRKSRVFIELNKHQLLAELKPTSLWMKAPVRIPREDIGMVFVEKPEASMYVAKRDPGFVVVVRTKSEGDVVLTNLCPNHAMAEAIVAAIVECR